MTLSPAQQSQLLDLSRAAIRRRLGTTDDLPEITDPALLVHAGCFVTLHALDTHQLRGCIGQIRASGPLRDSVLEMSEAVLDDPRFDNARVTAEQLGNIEVEITVLSPLELARNSLDFDLLEHGIYMTCSGSSGCFLPQVARETGWTKHQLLARLCGEKMGLSEDAWRKADARLYRFTTLIVGPEPFTKRA